MTRPAFKTRVSIFYPISQLYVLSVAIILGVVNGILSITQGLVILGFTCVITLGCILWKEVKALHDDVVWATAEVHTLHPDEQQEHSAPLA